MATDRFATILQRQGIIVKPIMFEGDGHAVANAGLSSEKLDLEELCDVLGNANISRLSRKTGEDRVTSMASEKVTS